MANALWIVCLPLVDSVCNSASANHSEGFFFFAWQISRTSANCSLRSSLLSDVSSVYLSYAFCKRSLMRESSAKAFVRGDGHVIMYPFSILGTHFSASSCPFLFGWNACVFWTVWKVMEMCYKILGEGKLVHQRSCSTSSSRSRPSTSAVSATSTEPFKVNKIPHSIWFLLEQRVPWS